MSCSLARSSFRKLAILFIETKKYDGMIYKLNPRSNFDPSAKFASSQHFDKSNNNNNNRVCWKCGLQRKDLSKVFCEECNVVQNPSDTHNYFKVFNLDEKFDIDQKVLREIYRKLQGALHPDKFSNKSDEEQAISAHYSSLVNKAYSSLQVPLKRAEHLLQLKGDTISEKQLPDNPEFLMEMMELNEEMENVTETPEKLKELNIRNKNELEKIAKEIDQCFKTNDLNRAKECIVRMKYYSSLGSRINSLMREKGIVD